MSHACGTAARFDGFKHHLPSKLTNTVNPLGIMAGLITPYLRRSFLTILLRMPGVPNAEVVGGRMLGEGGNGLAGLWLRIVLIPCVGAHVSEF